MIGTTWKSSPGAHPITHEIPSGNTPDGANRMFALPKHNSRASGSVRSEEENDCRQDQTKDAKESIDPAMQRSGARISFWWHGAKSEIRSQRSEIREYDLNTDDAHLSEGRRVHQRCRAGILSEHASCP